MLDFQATWVIHSLALALTGSLPLVHLGIFYRLMFEKVQVDRDECSCECWDRFFKGNYELKIAGFKHIYFNVTWQTGIIWFISLLALVALYEVIKFALTLQAKRQLRPLMLAVFLTCLYPNYYSWWSYFNYFNDSFYSQLLHQSIFTASELYVTIIAVIYFNKETPQSGKKLATALLITAFHILSACKDQFLSNVFMQQGKIHQVSRDVGLMVSDIVNLGLICYQYRRLATTPSFKTFNREEIILCLVLTLSTGVFLAIF